MRKTTCPFFRVFNHFGDMRGRTRRTRGRRIHSGRGCAAKAGARGGARGSPQGRAGGAPLREGDGVPRSARVARGARGAREQRRMISCNQQPQVYASRSANGTYDNKTLPEYSPRPARDGCAPRRSAAMCRTQGFREAGVGAGGRLDATGCACDAGPATAETAAWLVNMQCELGSAGHYD